MASAPQFAARGVGDVADADADTVPATQGAAAPSSSGIGRWLIGGLVVAAGVVAAAAAANSAKNRRDAQNQPAQPQQLAQQLACAPGHTLVNGFCQQIPPQFPPQACNAPQVLQNGQCITPPGAATGVWIIPVITLLVSMNGQLGILSGPNQGTYAGWSYRLTWCHAGAPPNCIDFKTMLSYTPKDALEDRELPKTAAAADNAMWREVQRINEALYRRGRAGYPPAAIFTSIIDASIRDGLAAKNVAVAVLAARARLANAGFPVDVAGTP